MRLPSHLVLRPEFQGGEASPQTPSSNGEGSTQAETGGDTKKEGGSGDASGGMLNSIIFFGGMILLFWFFLIAPERRRRREHQERLSQLKEKDRIVTLGGIHGTVVSLDEATVTIRIDDKRGTTMKLNRQAVHQTIARGEGEESQD